MTTSQTMIQGEEIDDDGPVIDINSKMIDNEDATKQYA
jgi:hypothetical protein